MEKNDKSRGFSVRETKLENGQVKLKLAVMPVPKRDVSQATSNVESCGSNSNHPPANADKGKWRPIGYSPVNDSSFSNVQAENFSQRSQTSASLLTNVYGSSVISPCFGSSSSSSLSISALDSSIHSPPSLKPFLLAAVVKPSSVMPCLSNSQAHPTCQGSQSFNSLYRCPTTSPSQSQNHPRASHKYDQLISSASDSEDVISSSESEKDGSPLFKSSKMSKTSHSFRADFQAVSARKKRREVDDLLNTWNIAPTAGKLLRQDVIIDMDSTQRSSRRSAMLSRPKSPGNTPILASSVHKRAPEVDKSLKNKQKVTENEDSSARPALSDEQLNAVTTKLGKIIVSYHVDSASGGRCNNRSTKIITFVSSLSPETTATITRKRFCASLLSPKKEETNVEATSTQLPPKKRHKQVSHSATNLHETSLDSATLNKLIERQRAAICYLRPSLFDLKRENEDRLVKMRAAAFPVLPLPLQGQKVQLTAKKPSKKLQFLNCSHTSRDVGDLPESRSPLKIRISLSGIKSSQLPTGPPFDKFESMSPNNLVKRRLKGSSAAPDLPYKSRLRHSATSDEQSNSTVATPNNIAPLPNLASPSNVKQHRSRPSKKLLTSIAKSSAQTVPTSLSENNCQSDKRSAHESTCLLRKRPPANKKEESNSSTDEMPLKKVACKLSSKSSQESARVVGKKTVRISTGKLALKKIKTNKNYQTAGLFSDTFKEERPLLSDPVDITSEKSSLASPTSDFSGDLFNFSPVSSPNQLQPIPIASASLGAGSLLPLPPPAALSVLYERSYFELPYDLYVRHIYGMISRPSHPGENFRRVRCNVYSSHSRNIVSRAEPPEPCRCELKGDVICVENCINKQLYVECSQQSCPCFSKCANRQFQTGGDISKIFRYETSDCGSGIKAKKLIRKGEFIVEYTGEVVPEREFRRRMVEWYAHDEHHYAFNLDHGFVIDAYRMGSLARFVNHSCEPNCQMQKWTVLGLPRVGLFALQDIQPGEQICYDYNFNWFDQETRQVCRCGSKECRGFIGAAPHRRNSLDQGIAIQPLKKWRLANHPKMFTVREYQILMEKHVILGRNVRSMARNLWAKMLRRKSKKTIVISHNLGKSKDDFSCSNPLFQAQFKALSNSRVSSRRLNEADNAGTSKSVELALFLEQLLTSLQMHRGADGCQTALPFINLPKRKQLPSYFSRIARPIDFCTIDKNITAGRYATFDSFNDDVRLLLDNVKTGGDLLLQPGKEVEPVFNDLRDTYDRLLRDFEKEILNFRKDMLPVESEDVVRCICGRLNEDGTMVQCEKCQLWQHVDCAGINVEAMPDDYKCFACSNSRITWSKGVPLPSYALPSDAKKNHKYFLTLCTKSGTQVRVDECYLINRQSLPNGVPFCKVDKLYPGVFYVDRLYIDEKNRKFIRGVHLVYPFELNIDHSRRFFSNEVLATLWYDELPIEIISGHCWVLESSIFARGRPRAVTSEDDVFICDNGLDSHAKSIHKLKEPMCTTCLKRYAFDYFLVPLRPERSVTAGEIHERMFAARRDDMAKRAAIATHGGNVSDCSSSSSSSPFGESDNDFNPPLGVERFQKRERLHEIMKKLASKIDLDISPSETHKWLLISSPYVRKSSTSSSTQDGNEAFVKSKTMSEIDSGNLFASSQCLKSDLDNCESWKNSSGASTDFDFYT